MILELLITVVIMGILYLVARKGDAFYYPTKKEIRMMKTKKGRRGLARLKRDRESINFGPM